jgi:hypothetical protein
MGAKDCTEPVFVFSPKLVEGVFVEVSWYEELESW